MPLDSKQTKDKKKEATPATTDPTQAPVSYPTVDDIFYWSNINKKRKPKNVVSDYDRLALD